MFSNTLQKASNQKHQQRKSDHKDNQAHLKPEVSPKLDESPVSHSPALSFRSKQQQPYGPRSRGSSDDPIKVEDSSDDILNDLKEKKPATIPKKSRKQKENSFASSTATSELDEDHHLSHRKTLGKTKEKPAASTKSKKQQFQVSSKRSERLRSSRSSPSPTRSRFLGVAIPPKTTSTEHTKTKANQQTSIQGDDRLKGKPTKPKGSAPKRPVFRQLIAGVNGPALTVFNDIDDDISPTQFNFINEHVCRPGTSRAGEGFNYGCNCYAENGRNMGCEYLTCDCLDDAATNESGKKMFPYTGSGFQKGFLRKAFLNTRNHIFECNAKCNCELNCKNRLVQHGRKVPLEIFKTKTRGWGLRCLVDLKEGQFVDTYRGEVITHAEANVREAAAGPGKNSYLYSLDKFAEECNYSEDEIHVVDGQYMGGPSRFINHSCDPNLRQFTVSMNHSDHHIYELAFFALEDIPAGTELTFNYTDNDDDEPVTDEEVGKRAEEAGGEATKCLCGAENCKKWLWL